MKVTMQVAVTLQKDMVAGITCSGSMRLAGLLKAYSFHPTDAILLIILKSWEMGKLNPEKEGHPTYDWGPQHLT